MEHPFAMPPAERVSCRVGRELGVRGVLESLADAKEQTADAHKAQMNKDLATMIDRAWGLKSCVHTYAYFFAAGDTDARNARIVGWWSL